MKKGLKRMIAAALAACSLLGICPNVTLADETISASVQYDAAQCSITVNGRGGNGGEGMTVAVVPSGATELSDAALPADLRIFVTEADGSFSKKIPLPLRLAGGKYRVYVYIGAAVSDAMEFIHINTAEAEEIIKAVDAAGDVAGVAGAISGNEMKVGIDETVFSANRDFISGIIFVQKPAGGYLSKDNPAAAMLAAYNTAVICIGLRNGGDSARLLSENSVLLGIDAEEYNKLSDSVKKELDILFGSADFLKESFAAVYNELLFCARMRAAVRANALKEVITSYGAEYGFDLADGSAYAKLKNKDGVFAKMLSSGISDVKTAAEALTLFDSAVKAAEDKTSGASGSDSGSASGGSVIVSTKPEKEQTRTTGLSDIENSWCRQIVSELYNRGIISGFADNTFRPDNKVSRAEFLQMVCTALGITSGGDAGFSDVAREDWYYTCVSAAAAKGIVSGYEDGSFRPADSISRQDAAVMIYRCVSERLSAQMKDFSDFGSISEYAQDAVAALAGAGVIKGSDGMFRPHGEMTRAEAAAMLYGALNMSAAPQDTPTVEISADKLALMTALGMQTQEKTADEKLTYGEFIKLAMTLIDSEGVARADKIKTPFESVLLGHPCAAAINAALAAGLIAENENVQADEYITPATAARFAVSAIGYTEYVSIKGVSYIEAANKTGLFSGMKNPEIYGMTYANSLTLLYNMLFAKVLEVASFDDGGSFKVSDRSYLEQHYGILTDTGIVEADGFTSLYDADGKVGEDEIQIDGRVFENRLGDSMIGHRVKYYYTDTDEPAVVFAEDKSKTLTFVPDDECSYKDLVYRTPEKKRAELVRGFALIYNGKAYDGYTDSDMLPDSGRVTLIDNDSNGKYDAVNIESYDFMYIQTVSATYNTIRDRNGAKTLDMSQDTYFDIYDAETGAELDISGLSGEDVIAYAASADRKRVKLYRLSGVTGVYKSYDDEKITIDNTEYYYNRYFSENYLGGLSAGTEAEYILDLNGKVTAVRNSYDTAFRYAYMVRVLRDSAEQTGIIKLFDQSGEMRRVEISERVDINGTTYKDALDEGSDLWTVLCPGGKTERRLMRYRTDADGKIRAINFAVDASDTAAAFGGALSRDSNLIRYYDGRTQNKLKFIWKPKTFGNLFNISSTKYLFVVPETEKYAEDDSYYAVGYSAFNTGAQYSVSAYNVNLAGCAEAVIYHVDLNEAATRQSMSGVVESVRDGLDKNGDTCKIVTVYNGEYTELEVPPGISLDGAGSGDYIRYNIHTNGLVTKITRDFDYKNWNVIYGSTADAYDCAAGQIYSFQDNYVMLSDKRKADGSFDMSVANLKNYRLDSYAVYDTAIGKVLTGNVEDLAVYINDAANASKIFIRFDNSMSTGYAVIYK